MVCLFHSFTMQIIMLLSKIRINSMAVVRMKYSDVKQPLNYDLTSSVEQVIMLRRSSFLMYNYLIIQPEVSHGFLY